jgi:hypothetical protein
VPEFIGGESEYSVCKIVYVKTHQVANPLEVPFSDSIHYMPVRAALLVQLDDDGERDRGVRDLRWAGLGCRDDGPRRAGAPYPRGESH